MSSVQFTYGNIEDCKQFYKKEQPKFQFIDKVQKFLAVKGDPAFVPIINTRYLDIFELYNYVLVRGGYDKVCKSNKWLEVTTLLKIPPNVASGEGFLQNTYSSLLLSYENHTKFKPTTVAQPLASLQKLPGNIPKPMINSNQRPLHSTTSSTMNSTTNINTYNTQMAYNQQQILYQQQQQQNIQQQQHLLQQQKRMKIETPQEINIKILNGINDLDSKDPSLVVRGLNFFSSRSFEMTDNNSIQLESYPQLLLSLSNLLDIVNPIGQFLLTEEQLLENHSNFWVNNNPIIGNLKFKVNSIILI